MELLWLAGSVSGKFWTRFVKKLFIYLTLSVTLSAEVKDHSAATETLREVWAKTWPVGFTEIVKSDITGKGVLLYREKDGQALVYTYIVFVPHFRVKKGELATDREKGRNMVVRLFLRPDTDREPEIKTGRFIEQSDRRNIIRWIR